MKFRLWPRTLATQLVIVTAAAVLISNLAVAAWFEFGRQQLTESALTDRLVDRAVSASTLLASIPAKQRSPAAHALSSGPWRFDVHRGKIVSAPYMNGAERALATRIQNLLPKGKTHRTVSVEFRTPTAEDLKRRPGSP